MIDDIELCRRILVVYADEDEYPTNIQFEELCSMFRDVDEGAMLLNVRSLEEQGLLEATIHDAGTFQKPNDMLVGVIYGIRPSIGSAFVREIRDAKKWQKAIENATKKAAKEGTPVVLKTILASLLAA